MKTYVKDNFLGEVALKGNRFTFDGSRPDDPDTLTFVTANVRRLSDKLVLVVDNDSLVYLKEWQVRPVYCQEEKIYGYAVRLDRKHFVPKKWDKRFLWFKFDGPDTFDFLKEVAVAQAHYLTWEYPAYERKPEKLVF